MPSSHHHHHKPGRSESSTSSSSLSLLSRNTRPSRVKSIKNNTEHLHHGDQKKIDLLNVQKRTQMTTRNSNSSSSSTVVQKKDAVAAVTRRNIQDHAEQMDIDDDIEVVDLCSPVMNNDVALAIVTTNNLSQLSLNTITTTTSTREQTSYKSRTLTPNSKRYFILPAFPASIENDHPHLLLVNVPNHLLTQEERDRRYSFQFPPQFLVTCTPPTNIPVNTNIPSFFLSFYQELFADLVEHLHLDMSIIDYNYVRLSKCIDIWAKERIIRFNYKRHEVVLDLKEYAIALEFFLQIDVDLFYMKTCSFRDVQPQEPNKFLFCSTDPVARYEMTACGNCGLCYPKYNVKRRGQPSVEFGSATQRHQFVNKYETILNCPCSCDTYNIIYVLTCPCGKFDYVGETGATLADRMTAHRHHGNRIMHEAFFGQENIKLAHPNFVKSQETLSKDEMCLYRHSIECQSAIQMFLDQNPRYWRFVPMSNEEADQPEQNIVMATMDFKSTDLKEHDKIKLFIRNLPPPPFNYRFSPRQYHLQYAYFKSERHLEMTNKHLDLYNAKIIAVLPETASTVLRQIVEALFITHAETKLNSSGRLVGNNNNNNNTNNNHNHENNDEDDYASNRHQNIVWCEGLVRRPITSIITAEDTSTLTTTTTTTTTT